MDDGQYASLTRMVWGEHGLGSQDARGRGQSGELYLILYPKELEAEVIDLLETVGVPGYTELPKLVGRGRRVRHFDNPIWPGATGGVFTVVTQEQAHALTAPFESLAAKLETRSRGLYGLHIYALPCRQVI